MPRQKKYRNIEYEEHRNKNTMEVSNKEMTIKFGMLESEIEILQERNEKMKANYLNEEKEKKQITKALEKMKNDCVYDIYKIKRRHRPTKLRTCNMRAGEAFPRGLKLGLLPPRCFRALLDAFCHNKFCFDGLMELQPTGRVVLEGGGPIWMSL